MLYFNASLLHSFDKAIQKEWLLTNGIGGYASSTVIGCNTRRHHGLLVAPIDEGISRVVFFSGINELFMIDTHRVALSTWQYADTIHPEGFRYLESFCLDPLPTFIYRVGDARLEKKIVMVQGENTVILMYRLLSSPLGQTGYLVIRPFLPCRESNSTAYETAHYHTPVHIDTGLIVCKPYEHIPPVYLSHNTDEFEVNGQWLKNIRYRMDNQRDISTQEDIYSPGQLNYILREGEHCFVVCSLQKKTMDNIHDAYDREAGRQKRFLTRSTFHDSFVDQLSIAADSFYLVPSSGDFCIQAGYHWFGRSTREMLIGLPGLCLATGNEEQARLLLKTLVRCCDRGFIPSSLDADPQQGLPYNAIDVSLWLFYAVSKYVHYTGDYMFIKTNILDTLLHIIDYYVKGTRYGVGMDQDGLIVCYERAMPLTWMDQHLPANDGTCRWGKLVEINALWYNALRVMEDIMQHFDKKLEGEYSHLANEVRDNFHRVFWNAQEEYLYDEVRQESKKRGFLVNQLFALSLPYPLVHKRYASKIFEKISTQLYTPFGLKPSSQSDLCFPWLLGHFYTAYTVVYPEADLLVDPMYTRFFDQMKHHIKDAGLNTLSECFRQKSENVFEPIGCISYSISVAECIRIWKEHVLPKQPIEARGE